MISGWTVYFIMILDSVVNFWVTMCVLSGIYTCVSLIIHIAVRCEEEQGNVDKKDVKRCDAYSFSIRKWAIPLFLIFCFLAVTTPNTKQMCTIVVVPKIVNTVAGNEQIQKLPENIVGLANDWIKSLSPVTTEKKDEK